MKQSEWDGRSNSTDNPGIMGTVPPWKIVVRPEPLKGNLERIGRARTTAGLMKINRKQRSERASGTYHASFPLMFFATPDTTENDWVRKVLFDQGYLAKIRGDAIKVYLAIIEACGGVSDRSVTVSLKHIMQRTELSCPTIIESLARLEKLGLVVSTTRQRGVKTYYVADPPAQVAAVHD
jgi:hypothetical protein